MEIVTWIGMVPVAELVDVDTLAVGVRARETGAV
jgi:hypothetical protein